MASSTAAPGMVHGVDLQPFVRLIDAIKVKPQWARFTIRRMSQKGAPSC